MSGNQADKLPPQVFQVNQEEMANLRRALYLSKSKREIQGNPRVAQVESPHIEDHPATGCAAVVPKTPINRAKARNHRYLIKNGRLYYVVEIDHAADIYKIENCQTNFTMWVSGVYLSKGVRWIARSRCNSDAPT